MGNKIAYLIHSMLYVPGLNYYHHTIILQLIVCVLYDSLEMLFVVLILLKHIYFDSTYWHAETSVLSSKSWICTASTVVLTLVTFTFYPKTSKI